MTKKGLHLTDAIDENLKLVKDEDGTDTPIQLSKDRLKINGDLEVGGEFKGDIILDGRNSIRSSPTSIQPLDIQARRINLGTYSGTVNIGLNTIVGSSIQNNFILDAIYGFSIHNILDTALDNPFNIVVGNTAGATTISTHVDVGNSADLKLDADGDIKLDSKTGIFDFYYNGVTADAFKITVAANTGVTTLSTISAGDDGDIILDADGDLILDSNSGKFIAKKAGTEFSVADSAYAGMILGYTAIGIDATRDSKSVGAAFAITDADHKVTFVAPPSGKVEIEISISVISTSIRWLVLGLADSALGSPIDFPNSNDVTNEHLVGDIQVEGESRVLHHKWVVEGLTAGTEYEWWLSCKAEQAGRVTLGWGGDATSEYPPFIMKATALPIGIYTG